MLSRLRATLLLAAFGCIVPILMIAQWTIRTLNPGGGGRLPMVFHRLAAHVLRLRTIVLGAPDTARPLFLIANHCSWLDIVVLGGAMPLAFIAKSDVADWPLIGSFARLSNTVFVDRRAREKTGESARRIARMLATGTPMVLFAEGTSSDGNHVLPFKSALLGAVPYVGGTGPVTLQPVSIAYVRRGGIPLGRNERADVAWYGDMDLVPHLWGVLVGPPLDVVITFGPPIVAGPGFDRKATARILHQQVRTMTAEAIAGRAPKDSA